MQSRPIVEIVGVPMDLGGNRRGVDMGPSGIRYAGLAAKLSEIGYRVRDRGNIRVKDPDEGRATHTYEKFEGATWKPKARRSSEPRRIRSTSPKTASASSSCCSGCS